MLLLRDLLGLSLGLAFVFAVTTLATPSSQAKPDREAARVARGKYLTHHVAMCIECHSGRADDGRLIDRQLFSGGRIPVEGPSWVEDWALSPPDLVGLAHLSPHRVFSVLTTGKRPNGTSPSPPMPPFRLSDEDARSVIAYLQSLER